jgi:hypothetical protein
VLVLLLLVLLAALHEARQPPSMSASATTAQSSACLQNMPVLSSVGDTCALQVEAQTPE